VSHILAQAMKTTIFLLLAVATVTTTRAEIFRSGAARGSRGEPHLSAHRGDLHRHGGHHGGHWGSHHRHTVVRIGLGHGYYGSPWGYGRGWGFYSPYRHVPGYSYYPGYGDAYPYYGTYGYGNGSYATNGLLLGALAGGIIGHNSGDFRHNGWRGAAWGAGLGWLLGTVADSNRRAAVYHSAPIISQPVAVQAQPAAQPQQVTIINNYYNSATPMSGANSLFGR
jgi:hypothetical protein